MFRCHCTDEEERGKRSSVGQKQHLGFWPTFPTVSFNPPLSSEIIVDLCVTCTNAFSRLRVQPSQMGVPTVVEPPTSSFTFSTIAEPSILVSVPGQRWGMISVCFCFQFRILLGAKLHLIGKSHGVSKGGYGVVEPSHCQHKVVSWTNLQQHCHY